MNEDYLWDQTGSDPEIEELELALKAFRYEPDAPPALPAPVAPPAPPKALPARRWLDLRLAFAVVPVAAVVLILIVAFAESSRRGDAPDADVAGKTPARPAAERAPKPEAVAPPAKITAAGSEPARAAQAPTLKIRRPLKTAPRIVKTVARRPEIKNEYLALSKDERYAYDQLMLALSITSEKLRIVKDKVDGADAPDARRAEER